MNIGEKCVVKVEPRLAFGIKGDLPKIKPNIKIEYEVELLDADFESEDLSMAQRRAIGYLLLRIVIVYIVIKILVM